MVIQITRREVLNNLIRLKDNLLEKTSEKGERIVHERMYAALLNRHTGDIRFSQDIGTLEPQLNRIPQGKGSFADWEEISLIAEDLEKTVHFRIEGPKGSSLEPTHFDPVATRILFETLYVLNQLAALYHSASEALPENAALQHLSDLHIAPVEEPVESMHGWSGQLSRIEAEERLLGRPTGTYLLRRGDELLNSVAQAFAEANQIAVQLYIVTFIEEEGKIADRLLISTQWGWTIARDESDLTSPLYEYYPSLNSILSSMNDQVKTPI